MKPEVQKNPSLNLSPERGEIFIYRIEQIYKELKAPLISGEGLGRGFSATEFNLYGSSRIGMVTQPEALAIIQKVNGLKK